MKRISFYAKRNRSGNLLHIETDGCTINIRVGLMDREGREVTSVMVSPDDETRGGDGSGRIWRQDGSRIIRLHEGEGGLVGTAPGKPHGTEYTLSQLRDGTGFPSGAKFVMVSDGKNC
jgi:hypothetical protein